MDQSNRLRLPPELCQQQERATHMQLEKEALALINGVRQFHKYFIGRKFKLVTDHQPLVKILGPKQGIPTLAAARLQRWAIILSAYDYDQERAIKRLTCFLDFRCQWKLLTPTR